MAEPSQGQRRSSRRLIMWAIATLVIGLLPIISSLLVELVAPQLGCLVIEHGAYTRLIPPEQYYGGDLRPGCTFGGVDIGPALHAMHMFIYGIVFTWPMVIASLVLWVALLFNWPRRRA
ncbi:MAG: hypothetical protein ACJ8E7_10065 [Sphingomicrobium sp.]